MSFRKIKTLPFCFVYLITSVHARMHYIAEIKKHRVSKKRKPVDALIYCDAKIIVVSRNALSNANCCVIWTEL